MSSDLVRTRLEKSIAVRSLKDLVRVRTSDKIFLLIDVSGSMHSTMRNGKQRIDALREVVRDIKSKRTDVRMIAFGGREGSAYEVQAVPDAGGGTPLRQAIDLGKKLEAGRAIVISDGEPEDPLGCLESAKTFGGQIDVVFVGDPGERGEEFLRRLAEATGGTEFHGDLSAPKELSGKIMGLLGAAEDTD